MKREHTEVRQQQIIEAAQAIIFRYGSEHLTVKRISEEVGISEAAIYRHFKSKKSILSLLLSHIGNILVADLSLDRSNGNMTLEMIRKTIEKHFSAIDIRKGVAFQVIAEIVSLGDRGLNRKTSATIKRYVSHLEKLLAQGVKSGCVRSDIDLEAAAMLLFGLIQSSVNIWALDNCSFKLSDRYASLWKIFCEAIAPR